MKNTLYNVQRIVRYKGSEMEKMMQEGCNKDSSGVLVATSSWKYLFNKQFKLET